MDQFEICRSARSRIEYPPRASALTYGLLDFSIKLTHYQRRRQQLTRHFTGPAPFTLVGIE